MINLAIQLILFTGLGLLVLQLINFRGDNWQKVLGESFFIGIFIVIFTNNIFQYFGVHLKQSYFFRTVLIISLFSIAYYLFRQSKDIIGFLKAFRVHNIKSLYVIFFGLLIVHMFFMFQQNILLPLTPWDAWSAWVAKAKIWYFFGLEQSIVNFQSWLNTPLAMENNAIHYPDGLSLLYLFNSGFFGWNETALNSLYMAMFVAFLLAFYGNIKQQSNQCLSIVGVVVFATLPFVNVHIILAGYADIWVAVFLVLVIMNAQRYISTRNYSYLYLTLVFSLALVMFKLEAFVWMILVVLATLSSIITKLKQRLMLLAFLVILFLWFITIGISLDLPFGQLVLSKEIFKIPGLGEYSLSFVNTTSAWIESLFISQNWHLLWYSIPVTLYLIIKIKARDVFMFTGLFLIGATVFLFVLFNLTYASKFALTFTSINRLILQITPVYIYFVMLVVNQFNKQKHPVVNRTIDVQDGNIF